MGVLALHRIIGGSPLPPYTLTLLMPTHAIHSSDDVINDCVFFASWLGRLKKNLIFLTLESVYYA